MGKIIAGLIGAAGLGTIFSFRKYLGIAIIMGMAIYGISYVKNDLVDLVKDARQRESTLQLEQLQLEKDRMRLRNEETIRLEQQQIEKERLRNEETIRLEQQQIEKERLRVENEANIRKEKLRLANEANIEKERLRVENLKKEQMRISEDKLQAAYVEVLKTQGYQRTFREQLSQTQDSAQQSRIRAAMNQNNTYISQQTLLIEQLKKEQFIIDSTTYITNEKLRFNKESMIANEQIRIEAETKIAIERLKIAAEADIAKEKLRLENQPAQIVIHQYKEQTYCNTYGWKPGDTIMVQGDDGKRILKTITRHIEDNSSRCARYTNKSLYAAE